MSRSTFSKDPKNYPPGYPERLIAGHGAYVWDRDSKQYIDWCQGLSGIGPLGHAHQKVVEAVTVALRFGTAFHVPHPLEDELAELLCSILPYAEDVRFCLNGTDPTEGAVRLARAVTGRTTVITFKNAYHGMSSDWQICGVEPARGVPKEYPKPIKVEWNNCEALGAAVDKYSVAAVIFEVPTADPTPEFVEELNDTRGLNCLLIADEVVTGFRFGLQGACGQFGIKPDLACFGKAFGAGFPVAALVGRQDLIDEFYAIEPVFMSYTHAGNTVGLAAAKASIEVLRDDFDWPKFQKIGEDLKWAFGEEFSHLGGRAVGQPSRHQFRFPHDYQFQAFMRECAKHGVLFGVTNSPTERHGGGVLERTKSVMRRHARWAVEASEPVSAVKLYDVRGRDDQIRSGDRQ